MSAELDRIAEIRESLDRMQQVARAVAADGTPTDVADPTGTVRVHLDPAGTITSLVVDADWREQHAPGELGTVVRDTVRAAESMRLRNELTAISERLRDAPPTTRPMPQPSDTFTGRLQAIVAEQPAGTIDRAAVEHALKDLTADVVRAVEEEERRRDARRGARYDGGAGHGVVAVTDGDGRLVDVGYDLTWLHGQSAFALSLATTDAITRARSVAAAEQATTALGRLVRDLTDPAAFVGRLGIGDGGVTA